MLSRTTSKKNLAFIFPVALTSAFSFTLIAGCSNPSKEPSVYDAAMAQQQTAIRTVQVFKAVPAGALGVRSVMAAACGTDPKDTGPDENYILTGLKLKAFKGGADGIAEVEISKLPDASGHCEVGFAVGGTARAFTIQR